MAGDRGRGDEGGRRGLGGVGEVVDGHVVGQAVGGTKRASSGGQVVRRQVVGGFLPAACPPPSSTLPSIVPVPNSLRPPNPTSPVYIRNAY